MHMPDMPKPIARENIIIIHVGLAAFIINNVNLSLKTISVNVRGTPDSR